MKSPWQSRGIYCMIFSKHEAKNCSSIITKVFVWENESFLNIHILKIEKLLGQFKHGISNKTLFNKKKSEKWQNEKFPMVVNDFKIILSQNFPPLVLLDKALSL